MVLKMNKQSYYTIIGRVFMGIGQLLIIRILTSILNADEIGKYYLLMSIVSVFLLSVVNPVSTFVQRHWVGWSNYGLGKVVINRLFIFIATACVAISIIVTVGHKYFATYNNMNIVFLAIAVPFLVLVSFGSNLFPILINIIGKFG